jgi:2-keto-4-pentenoate hydratase/2-oxohepta-3-ene-1,7-dioic acid hydratase in catechol pathway
VSGAPFAFARFGDTRREFLGAVQGQQVFSLGSLLSDIDDQGPLDQLFKWWDEHVAAVERALAAGTTAIGTIDGLRRLRPVAPRQVLLAGMNYRTHVIQLMVDQGTGSRPGMTTDEIRQEATGLMDERVASGTPFVFIGLPTALCGPDDDIHLRADSTKNDWELELAAVIGRPTRNVTRAEALRQVAGWTIVNDLTCRDLIARRDAGLVGADWLRAKMSPGYKPVGPNVVPAKFVEDPQALTITLRLNGQVMQNESTGDMLYDVASLVSYCSQQTELLPGDLVLTGSPAGNGTHHGRFLTDGDLVEGEITGLGVQRNRCVL